MYNNNSQLGATYDNLPTILASQRISSKELVKPELKKGFGSHVASNFEIGGRRNTSSFLNTNNPFFSPRNVSQYLASPDMIRNQMNKTIQLGAGDGYAMGGGDG